MRHLFSLAFVRAKRSCRRALLGFAGITPVHGLWGPGIRLFRDVSLAAKGWAVMGCLLVPLLVLVTHEVVESLEELTLYEEAQTSIRHWDSLRGLQTVVTDLMGQRFPGNKKSDLTAGINSAESTAFARVQESLSPSTATAVQRALQTLTERRKAALESLKPGADFRTAGGPWASSMALQAYLLALAPLKQESLPALKAVTERHPDMAALQQGALHMSSRLDLALQRLADAGIDTLASEARASARAKMHDAGIEVRVLMDISRPALEAAVAWGALDAHLLDTQWQRVQQLLDASLSVGRAASTAASQAEVAAISGLDAPQYASIATAAISARADLHAAAARSLSARMDAGLSALRQRLALAVAMSMVGIVMGVYVVLSVYKVVAGGILSICSHAAAMAEGRLALQARGWGKDEFGKALTSLGESSRHMAQLLETVTQGVSAVSLASRDVAQGNASLKGRTGEIRGSIADVARRTHSFSGAMDSCAVQVEQAAEHVRAMRANARRSRKAVQGLREGMRNLRAKSSEITQVVTLVESVTYQTKLLALNASVEAARAGPAGKGFAVVAQEVRALAQRSEEAAQRIHDIVTASVEEIEQGNLMAERVDEAVQQTDEKIETVDLIMSEVVQLTRSGMEESQQVLGIARNVEESANGNSQIVEQLFEASTSLREQGDRLKRSVQPFVLA
jgi:methyl-accepting chemotaxis protein